MVEIEFVNGDKETVETREDEYSPWAYMDDVGCFFVPSIEGDFYILNLHRLQQRL